MKNIFKLFAPKSPKAPTWKERFAALWKQLVPAQGPAATVQGEVIRIAGKIEDEMNRNGGANWDRQYRKMLTALKKHLASANALSPEKLEEVKKIASIIPGWETGREHTDRLCELAVEWVEANPDPAPLPAVNYAR